MLVGDVSVSAELSQGGLRSVVRRCAERARPGAPQVLRLVTSMPDQHPLALLSPDQFRIPATSTGPVVAWQDARRHSVFAAWGSCVQVATSGTNRVRRAALDAAALAERTTTVDPGGRHVPDTDLPLLCGGFAFASHVSDESPWQGWPAGWLFVPRLLVHRASDGVTLLVLSEQIAHDTHPELVMQRIGAALRARPRAHDAKAAAQALPATQLSEDSGALQSWMSSVSKAHMTMRRGALEKVVLARSVAVQRPGAPFDPLTSLERLRQRHGDPADGCTLFAMRHPSGRTFLGASPETLVDLSDSTVRTSALAGTAARELDPERDAAAAEGLRTSWKEQAEHRFVVRAIADALKPRCARLEVDDAPRVRRLKTVQHLETAFTGRLQAPTHILDLVHALHPTPAVGGWPTAAAVQWIAHNEHLERGWYSGPVGWITRQGDGHFVVALRCALVDSDNAWAFAGAGLTEGSRPAREWTETVLKLQTIADALACRADEGSA
jgi:salicylate biosynthesis isochorismate synthase